MPIVTLILKAGTAAEWSSANPVLVEGEPGWDTDVEKGKVGNGVTPWNSLPFVLGVTGAVASVNGQTGAVALVASDVGAASTVHTHVVANITDFETGTQFVLADSLVAGTNIDFDTAGGVITINATGGGGGGGDLNDLDDVNTAAAVNGQYLKRVSGTWVGDTLTSSDINDIANVLNRANHTGEVALSSMASDVSDTPPLVDQVLQFDGTDYVPTTPPDPDLKADVSGSINQFADFDDSAPIDGMVPVFDDGVDAYVPTDLDDTYARVDSAGRLDPTNWQKYFVPMVILNDGESAPADFPTHGIGFKRPPSTAPTPILQDTEFANASGVTTLTLTGPTDDLEVDDWIGVAFMFDGSTTTGSLPTTITSLAPAVGAWTPNSGPEAHQSGTVQVNINYYKVTTLIPAGTDILLTVNQTRIHRAAIMFKMPNLVPAAPADQTITNQGGSVAGASPIALTAGPSAARSQANELGILVVGHNDGGAGITRTVGGADGWAVLAALESDNGSTSRGLTVLYKEYTTAGTLAGAVAVTTSDGASGAFAIVGQSFKAA